MGRQRSLAADGATVRRVAAALILGAAAAAFGLLITRGREAHGQPGRPAAGGAFRNPEEVLPLTPVAGARRNVLIVLTEGTRFDSVCTEPDAGCKLTPFTDRVANSRLPLLQMRSTSSTTAISLAVIWSGLPPTQAAAAITRAPLIFDFARAAGYDTAYWSSQAFMFTHSPEFFAALPVSHRCSAPDVDPIPDPDLGAKDELLTQRAKRDLAALTEPWLAVVQYANTHYPYRVRRGDRPFQPATESKDPEQNAAFMNHYRNAVYSQDRTIGDLLSSVRSGAAGKRTVVIYVSDHGEAFRDHGQLGHTTSLFDEEIHVPAWIDAPEGALSPTELAALTAARHAFTWHVDLAPTVLDLLGVWDSPGVARFRSRMIGTSLLRRQRTAVGIALTNCTDIWGCGYRNWGLMKGSRKLEARESDAAWHCWDVASDPAEQHDLGAVECPSLTRAAAILFGGLPKDAAEMRGFGP
jgi:membrane-anchored protein YejM (alkaline phosphatase superfamily)